ncbi:MAG TPA: hypothetical protein VN372_05240 [Methanospirillum sp.]|nr:hypothetical protein [Methanospirillum sp.]
MNDQDFQVTTVIRLEGKIPAKFRETAEAEAESAIRSKLKELPPWIKLIEFGVTATRRIL